MFQAISDIIAHINGGEFGQAITQWSAIREKTNACDPCLYVELSPKLRCANCMEAKLRTMSITRMMPEIPVEELDDAVKSLGEWVRNNSPA